MRSFEKHAKANNFSSHHSFTAKRPEPQNILDLGVRRQVNRDVATAPIVFELQNIFRLQAGDKCLTTSGDEEFFIVANEHDFCACGGLQAVSQHGVIGTGTLVPY